MSEEEVLPDHLRCNRTDGRQWRCNRPVMENKKLCEIHHLQGRHRQYKQKVPESLKIQRKNKNLSSRNLTSSLQGHKFRVKNAERLMKLAKKPMKKKRKLRVIEKSEALDEAVKKMKLKRGDLQLELIRMVLKREVEKEKKRVRDFDGDGEETEEEDEEEFMRDLPNGLMAISSLSPRYKDGNEKNDENSDNAGPSFDVKIGVRGRGSSGTVTQRRCFRSKNIEPVPVGATQVLPWKGNVLNLRRGKRKRCHCCRKGGIRRLVKCSSCRKEFFCINCIKERYFESQEEVRMACPICRGTCGCKACSANQDSDIGREDLLREKNKIDRVLWFHYLICMLLPVLKQINQEESIELETEAKLKGQEPSKVIIQQAESSCNKQHCCTNCKTSILNIHRSCPSCSYNLCSSCCWDIFQGYLPGNIKALLCKSPDGKKTCIPGIPFSENKSVSTSTKSYSSTYFDSSASLPSKAPDGSIGISCPPTELGGCGDGVLDLKFVFPLSWTKELEISAEEIVGSYELPETVDISSCCSLCLGLAHQDYGVKQLQEAARREGSNDNFLYYPTILDVHIDNAEHFQKHWGKGHPVIVQNVLQDASDLNWDPVVMFCTYLKNSKSENDEEVKGATNDLDWFEVEIGVRQVFLGSLMGRTHANICDEKLKLKGWLSSRLFQKQFPAHYDQVIHALPLPEYMDPKSGLLNIAAKLPHDMQKPDLGPCVYISYGSGGEVTQADSVRKLCYAMSDVVNILAHATDVPVSTKELNIIRKLVKNAQDQRESTELAPHQQKGACEVERKSSLHGENMDVELHNVDAEEKHRYRSGTHEAPDSCLKDRDLSCNREHISDFDTDSEASILNCGAMEQLRASKNQTCFSDPGDNSGNARKKKVDESCGAQWDVFRKQDVPKLIEYLRRHSNEFTHLNGYRKHVVHPIFDQNFFLDTTHKMRLKEEFEIEPWSFVQHVGEAVIVPAGCPYQIRNLKSCVNVVLDFVSPENVTESIQLIEEVRLLPHDHKAKAYKPEVKKMAIYSINAAIKGIRELTCSDS